MRGAGGERTQVITDLGELHGRALDRTVQHHAGAAVGGRFDEVLCRHVGTTGDLGQTLDGKTGVLGRSVQTGTDGGGARLLQQQLLATLDGFDLFTQGDGEAWNS